MSPDWTRAPGELHGSPGSFALERTWGYADTGGRLTITSMKDPDLTSRVADSKPKQRQDDGRWSQDLYVQVRSFSGGSWAEWVSLTFSEAEGYGVIYDGDRPEIVQYLEGLCENGVLHHLDEYVNGRAEQDRDQTDEQMGDDD